VKAISVRAPWWWFILHAGKDIENRSLNFPLSVRGTVWLHCGKWWEDEEVEWDADDAMTMWRKATGDGGSIVPEDGWDSLKEWCGCIVGSVEVVDYVTQSNSPWFVGELGIVLRNPVALSTPIPCRGYLGYFDVPDLLIGDAA